MAALAFALPAVAAFSVGRPSSRTTSGRERWGLSWPSQGRHPSLASTVDEGADDFEDDEELAPPSLGFFEDEAELAEEEEELWSMAVPQLRQQLRLRGKNTSGTKDQLVARLIEVKKALEDANVLETSKQEKPAAPKEPRRKAAAADPKVLEAKARGADVVDVTEFLGAEDAGKAFRSSDRPRDVDAAPIDVEVIDEGAPAAREDTTGATPPASSSSSPEVWGEDARIVDDYEGRSVVVDELSRAVVEYTGAGGVVVRAYAVGSRDALQEFMRGGAAARENDKDAAGGKKGGTTTAAPASKEEEVYAIQRRREQETRPPIRPDEVEGEDDPEAPMEDVVVERDFGDWGIYTPTGAQLSSAEVQGVLLLSDVHGPFTDDTRALADKIALECQPLVVLAPDLFRSKPWTADAVLDDEGVARNEEGRSYEEWRALHPGRRVDVDVRAAAAVLRERYGVASLAVWGTCYGGGRALEAAAGWYEGGVADYYEDACGPGDPRPAPPHVDPVAAIAWYPTRYDATKLFGDRNEGFRAREDGEERSVAVMALFAGDDALPGATPEDAEVLKDCLDEDPRVKDSLVKVFPDQGHGFAHAHLSADGAAGGDDAAAERFSGEDYGAADQVDAIGDAEVARLLSTAFMETYTRVFLPTTGTPVRADLDARWSSALEMDVAAPRRRQDIRDELEEAASRHEDMDVDFGRMPQSPTQLMDGPGSEEFERIEEERERRRREVVDKYDLSDEDEEETRTEKLRRAKADGALEGLFVENEEWERSRKEFIERYHLSPKDDDETKMKKIQRANEDGALEELLEILAASKAFEKGVNN